MSSEKKYFPVFLDADERTLLLIGNSEAIIQKLRTVFDFSFRRIMVFSESSDELDLMAENYPFLEVFHETSVQENHVKQADIMVVLPDADQDYEKLKKMANRHSVFIQLENEKSRKHFPKMASEEDKAKKYILNKVKHDIPATQQYQSPYDVMEYIYGYANAAKTKANIYLAIIGIMIFVGLFFITIYEFNLYPEVKYFLSKENHIFYWMVFVGFLAEMIAGSMGMGYGVICTTILLFLNVPPPIVSASIHSAESFTSAAGTASHFKLRNVNMKLVKALAPFAILGAIIGSLSLTYFGERYATVVKPLIAGYTLLIGVNIFVKTISKNNSKKHPHKRSNLKFLGIIGGFIDSFVGGGWGPLVTGSLIKDGRTPRYAIGSSTFAKFLLTITSAVTFLFTLGTYHWNIVLGLLIGGVITAPFSAMLTAKLPVKKMTLFISVLVIVMSSITIVKSLL